MLNKLKILIADDDANVRKSLSLYFEREQMQIIEGVDGEEAVEKTKQYKPDMVILDIMMPKKDGMTACREIRSFSNVPIIVLSAKGEELDKLLGLELGADDYITKPFSPREVVARVKAVLRRMREAEGDREQLTCNSLCLHVKNRTVTLGDKDIAVTPKEFDLLYLLMSNKRQVFSREVLLERVWGYEFFGDTRTVDTHIKRIRQKLNSEDFELRTVWGVGYSFEPK